MSIPEIEGLTATRELLPTQVAALAGIATPLSGFVVGDTNATQIAVILSVSNGVLYADTAPGAAVGGGGSGAIWIAGSPAQVNAKLATVVYASSTPGADAVVVSVIDPLGTASARVNVPLQVLPLSVPPAQDGASVSITGGTITLDARTIDGLTLNVTERQGSANSPALVLANSTLGVNTNIDIADQNGTGAGAPRLAIAGRLENNGTARFSGGPALITLAKGALLINAGHIEFAESSAQVSGEGTLQNDGAITIAAAAGASPLIAVTITGAGVIALGSGARAELTQSVAPNQTIRFDAPGQEVLRLDQPEGVQAELAGFAPGDQIVLANTRFDAAAYAQTGVSSGVLTLFDGPAVEASLRFAGSYRLSSFNLLSTGVGSAGQSVCITAAATPAPTDHVSIEVYRFFDRALGTQMLTQADGERNALVANRRDLVYEGVGLRALDPQAPDPGAVPVYRFFDTMNGTHFFSASGAEKDAILATRPDLIFEPGSTLYEHATPAAGDVPVFRFFDSAHGTHLYTEDAGERASILSARVDLRDEGVVFYAPGV